MCHLLQIELNTITYELYVMTWVQRYNIPHTIIVSGCKNKSYTSSTILS